MRYFQVNCKLANGALAWPQPKGITASPDTTVTPNLSASQVAINKALAEAGAGATLGYLSDLGSVDIQ